jgi:methylenetetrahydrofolate dehydrogenase (NADP+) / methenyltetrahydrofolate cyclohydrolase
MILIDNKIIDGKALSDKIIRETRDSLRDKNNLRGLAVLLIGDNASSHLYVKLKKRACLKCGIPFHQYNFDKQSSEQEILDCINFLNKDDEVAGILIQLPLPNHLNTDKIIEAMDYRKDIDGFHPRNQENMKKCVYKMLPPLPLGIYEMIKATGEQITNKNIVVLCNHTLFGDPFKCFWGQDNHVSVVTTEDKNWKNLVKEADILIVSVGIAFFITKDMIKKDSIIIDVGINKLHDGAIVGDVNLDDVIDTVKYISPVPGGVGPMTIAMLLKNLIDLQKNID